MQRMLIKFLGYMSILSVIQMGIFYNDLTEKDINSIEKSLGPSQWLSSRFSLGSYYQGYPDCHSVPVDLDKLQLKCKGTLLIQNITDVDVFKST